MENQFCRVVQWVDDSTKIFDRIQLFEETISYPIGHPPVETDIYKFTICTGIRWIPDPSKDNQVTTWLSFISIATIY